MPKILGTGPERCTIYQAYALGFTGVEIAEGVCRSPDFVWRVLAQLEVPRRSRRKGRTDAVSHARNVATVRDMLAAQRRIA